MFSAEERPPSPLETFYQSTEFQKVQPSATSNLPLVIRDLTQDAQEPTPPLLDTLMMAARPESDSHQVPERPFQASAEPPSVSLPVEEETRSQSWRPEHFSTSSRDSERDSHKSEVWEWTPSTIPTEVVTISIWVSQVPSTDLPHQVKRSVLSLPEELVSLEVPKPSSTFPKRFD